MPPPFEDSISYPLRGRDNELAVVVGELAGGTAGVVVVTGPAGAGKSALAEAALAHPSLKARPVGVARFPPSGKLGVAALVGTVDGLLAQILENLFDRRLPAGAFVVAASADRAR